MRSIITVFFLVMLIDMSSDMYIPSLSLLVSHYNVNASIVQLTVSSYLIGLMLSSLIYGIMADTYGRKTVIIIGLSIFTVAALACHFSVTIEQLIFARLIQGIGGGVGGTIGYTCIADMYSGKQCSKILSRFNLAIAFSPAIGPLIGGLIATYYGWQYIFPVIFAASLVVLIITILSFQETLKKQFRTPLSIASSLNCYIGLFGNKHFLFNGLIVMLTFTSLWLEVSYSPIIFDTLKVPLQYYGYYITVIVISYMVGTIVNQYNVMKVGTYKMLLYGIIITILSNLASVLINTFIGLNRFTMTGLWCCDSFAMALILSNAISNTLSAIPTTEKAHGSAMLSALEMLSGAIGIVILGLYYESFNDLFINIEIISILSLLMFFKANKLQKI